MRDGTSMVRLKDIEPIAKHIVNAGIVIFDKLIKTSELFVGIADLFLQNRDPLMNRLNVRACFSVFVSAADLDEFARPGAEDPLELLDPRLGLEGGRGR